MKMLMWLAIADEVHKPPGDPQDKTYPQKIIINTKRKHQEPF